MSLRLDQRRFWVVELDVFGRTVRFSTLRLEIQTRDGDLVVVREGLGEDFEVRKGVGDVAELSVAVSIGAEDLEGVAGDPDEIGSWAGLYAAGYDLERQPGRLLRWLPGTDFEACEVVLRGVVEEVAIGGPDEPLEFTLARSPMRESRPLIAADAKVSSSTFPVRPGYTADESIFGAWYPLPIGSPGGGGEDDLPRVPAFLVEDAQSPTPTARESRLLVGNGRVDAANVLVFQEVSDGEALSEVRPVFEMEDGNGRTVSVVDFDGASTISHELGFRYYTSWKTSAANRGGGIARRDGSGALRGLGEVLRYLLEEFSDLDVDGPAMEGERQRLDAFRIDTFVNEPADVWSWITDELFPLVPLKVVEGPNGVWIRLMRFDAGPTDATFFLDGDDPRISRTSRLTSSRWDEVANELRFDFAANRNAPNFTDYRVLTGREVSDPKSSFSYRCGVSQRKLERRGRPGSGVRTVVLQGGAHVYDPTTAGNILRMKAAELAIPHKRATWVGPESLEDALTPGDVVLVRDTEIGIPEPRVALVDEVVVGGGQTSAALIVLEDPARLERVFRSL